MTDRTCPYGCIFHGQRLVGDCRRPEQRDCALHREDGETHGAGTTRIQVGELVGWRAWRLVWLDDRGNYSYGPLPDLRGPFLKSVAMTATWWPLHPMTGDPLKNHYTGIYAFREPITVSRVFYPLASALVYGTCWLWGAVAIHRLGYRAEYARPRTLGGMIAKRLFTKREVRETLVQLRETYQTLDVEDD